MVLEYDFTTQKLNVTITHDVPTPDTHYIETVEIYKNNTLLNSYPYTSQPTTSTFSYEYDVSAVDGDVIKVNITCSISGKLTEQITVVEPVPPPKKMTLTTTPDISTIDEETIQVFNVTVKEDSQLLDGVTLVVTVDAGSISNIDQVSSGLHQFNYTAPDVTTDTNSKINITASKNGYETAYKELQFTIKYLELDDNKTNGVKEPAFDGIIGDKEYDFSANFGDENYKIHWRIDGDEIIFGIAGKTTGWVSLGIEPSIRMKDADMIFGWVDSSGKVNMLDAYSTGETGPHPPDTTLGGTDNILDYGGKEENGWTVIEFNRKLETGDSQDKYIDPKGEIKIVWALGSTDDYTQQHSERGSGVLNIATGESEETEDVQWIFHAVFMSLGFILLIVGIVIAKAMRKKAWWLKTHKIVTSLGATLVIVGIGFGIYMVSISHGQHLRLPHTYLDIITIIFILITVRLGFSQLKAKEKAPKISMIHRWLGRITMVVMLVSILSGLMIAGVI
jgi:hypothetical protein